MGGFGGLETLVHQDGWLLDFGCGRIFSAMDALGREGWISLHRAIDAVNGHGTMEKSPDAFRRTQDVFGAVPPWEWALTHRIKTALDPMGLFSPGRLPGHV